MDQSTLSLPQWEWELDQQLIDVIDLDTAEDDVVDLAPTTSIVPRQLVPLDGGDGDDDYDDDDDGGDGADDYDDDDDGDSDDYDRHRPLRGPAPPTSTRFVTFVIGNNNTLVFNPTGCQFFFN